MKIIPGLRRRYYLGRVGIFFVIVVLIAGMAGCNYIHPSKDLEIRTWYDLDAVRDNLGGNHVVMNDLDSSTAGYDELASPTANQGKGWQPIGGEFSLFTGSFDGQGHEIRGLFINRPDEYWVGLFSTVDEEGVIENIGVVNANVTAEHGIGVLAGFNGGTVSNSYSTGRVTGESTAGGLLGQSRGTVSKSHFTGNVTGSSSVGGLVGVNGYGTLGTVSNSYSSSNVTGVDDVGGLVGFSDGTVSNSYSSSNVTGVDDVGGLVGANDGGVNNSFWDIETSGQFTSDGGTGKNTTEMQNITTFSEVGWNIIAVALNETEPAYIWNIVNNVTYPFLGWQ